MAERLLTAAAAVPFGMAVVVVIVGLVRAPAARRAAPAELVASLGLALEFLLAAGLLRLAVVETFLQLAAVAAIVALRRVLTLGLRYGLRGLDADRFTRLRA